MAKSTVYEVRLNYVLEDKTSKPLRKLDAQLARTTKTAGGLGRQFKRLAVGASAYFGIRAGVKHLIGFNSNMEQAKIQMAGMIQLSTRMGTEASSKEAIKLVDVLQQKAKASVGTTADMVAMAGLITRPILTAGLGMDKLADITAQTVVAAKAFGIEAGMAARDIEAALMGQLRSVDRFSRALLEPLGFVGEEGRKAFNELGAAARAAKFEEALGGPAIQAMAKAQEQSLDGVLSTFQDSLQMTMGAIGKPLFKEITEEIKTWNVWIEKNGTKLSEIAKSWGKGLVSGFRIVKSVVGFMISHADLLLTVAKAWAAVKIGQKLGGITESLGQVAGRVTRRAGGLAMMANFDKAGLGAAKFGIKITSAATKFASLLPAIGLAAVALEGLWNWWTKEDRERAAKQRIREKEIKEKIQPFDPKFLEKEGAPGALKSFAGELAELERIQSARTGAEMTAREAQLSVGLTTKSGELKALLQNVAGFALSAKIMDDQGQVMTQSLEGMKALVREQLAKQGLTGLGEARIGEEAVISGISLLQDVLADSFDPQGDFIKSLKGQLLPFAIAEAQRGLAPTPDLPGLDDRNKKTPDMKVTIQRIEVQSDDPDRFVVGLSETILDAARNRSSAFDTLMEGR